MSGKLVLLLLILVAGIACQQYKGVKGNTVITLFEDTKYDNSERK